MWSTDLKQTKTHHEARWCEKKRLWRGRVGPEILKKTHSQTSIIWAWGSKLMKKNKVYLYNLLDLEFPISSNKDAFYLPGIGRLPLHRR